jgi:sterol 3beta-glucosyltransferase
MRRMFAAANCASEQTQGDFLTSVLESKRPRIPIVALKRIAILSAGSRGDVYPYAALGRAIVARGCAARLVTFTPFREFVTDIGLEFFPVTDPMTAVKSSDDWRCWQSSNTNLPRKLWSLRRMLEACREPFLRMLDECLDGCAGCDAVVSASSGFAGPHIAEKLGLPFGWGFLQPETSTRCFPHYLSPWSRSLGKSLNHATYSVAGWITRFLFENALASWRRNSLRLPPSSVGIVAGSESPPVVYGFSPHVISKPPDWGENTHVAGYWFLDAGAPWTPSQQLSRFLADNPHAIAVCLDSLRGEPNILDVVTGAVRQTGQRALVITGGGAARGEELTDLVTTVDFVPYQWLFPRVSAVIHHGGAGTAAAALRARRPSVLLPSFFDQSFWANRMFRLGVCPAPLSPHRLSVRNLAAAIDVIITEPEYRRRASILGERICEEDGAGSAADIFLRHFKITPC